MNLHFRRRGSQCPCRVNEEPVYKASHMTRYQPITAPSFSVTFVLFFPTEIFRGPAPSPALKAIPPNLEIQPHPSRQNCPLWNGLRSFGQSLFIMALLVCSLGWQLILSSGERNYRLCVSSSLQET